jgi:hypothetical protein
MKATTSLILGALLIAGLSLALACCGTPTPDMEETVQAALVATFTAQPTERPLPTSTSTAAPGATPIATPTATPTPEPHPGYAWPSAPERPESH